MRTWPTPTHLERCGSASIEPARRGFEPHQSGAAYLALCCHTYAAMRNRGNKQKAYVQASFLLSRRDDHHERDWAGPGTRERQLSAASSCHLLIMKVLRTDIVQR